MHWAPRRYLPNRSPPPPCWAAPVNKKKHTRLEFSRHLQALSFPGTLPSHGDVGTECHLPSRHARCHRPATMSCIFASSFAAVLCIYRTVVATIWDCQRARSLGRTKPSSDGESPTNPGPGQRSCATVRTGKRGGKYALNTGVQDLVLGSQSRYANAAAVAQAWGLLHATAHRRVAWRAGSTERLLAATQGTGCA